MIWFRRFWGEEQDYVRKKNRFLKCVCSGSRCGSAVKRRNKKIIEIKDSGFAPHPGQLFLKCVRLGISKYRGLIKMLVSNFEKVWNFDHSKHDRLFLAWSSGLRSIWDRIHSVFILVYLIRIIFMKILQIKIYLTAMNATLGINVYKRKQNI
jgi:hypothetical protein